MSIGRLLLAVPAVLAVAAVTACDDGDAATPDTTESAVTELSSTSAPAQTSAAQSTPPSTEPPTSTQPPPTTSAEEALKAQIAADYVASVDRYFELVNQPTLDNLAERAKLAAAEGSGYYASVIDQVEDLVAVGDRIVPNDPDIRRLEVESVELVGAQPYAEALVTVCAVDNSKRITPPENSPNGQETLTLGTGELVAVRRQEPVALTPQGWLPTAATVDAIGIWEGSEQCGPA